MFPSIFFGGPFKAPDSKVPADHGSLREDLPRGCGGSKCEIPGCRPYPALAHKLYPYFIIIIIIKLCPLHRSNAFFKESFRSCRSKPERLVARHCKQVAIAFPRCIVGVQSEQRTLHLLRSVMYDDNSILGIGSLSNDQPLASRPHTARPATCMNFCLSRSSCSKGKPMELCSVVVDLPS